MRRGQPHLVAQGRHAGLPYLTKRRQAVEYYLTGLGVILTFSGIGFLGPTKMKGTMASLVAGGLLLVLLPGTTAARVSFGISIGMPFVYHYPGFHHGWYPYYHSYPYYGWYPHYGRHSSSELGIWIGGYHPVVIDSPVIVRRKAAPKTGGAVPDAQTAEQLERLRQKKSELLKVLGIGDKERRIQAIHDLAGYSCDDGVRKALENVLLSDPDPQLRKEVATSFGKTENRKVVAALVEAKATDSSKEVRQAAYRSIILIKGY